MALKTSSNVVRHEVEKRMFRLRKRLLLQLANLRDDGIERFRKRIIGTRFPYEADVFWKNYRNALREVWRQPAVTAQSFVDDLIHHSVIEFGNVGFIGPIADGRLTAAPQNFQGQLAVAVLENWRLFAYCGNPECPAHYFLAKRRTQKYCERGSCTAYAQRRYALSWWDKEGRKRRASSKKIPGNKAS
jgi:hypothetical protein